MRKTVFTCSVLAVALFSLPSRADTRLGLNADYVTDNTGMFQMTLGADAYLAWPLAIGARGGIMFLTNSDGTALGAPVDFYLRFAPNRLYVDGMVGPWFFFSGDPAAVMHAGVGIGVRTRWIDAGLEAGGLSTGETLFGVRFAFRI
jgi:hypothetical protein